MASTPSYVDAGRLRADTCGPGVLNRLFVGQRYMLVRYSDHSPGATRVTSGRRRPRACRRAVRPIRTSVQLGCTLDPRVDVYDRLVGFRVVLLDRVSVGPRPRWRSMRDV